MRRQQVSSGSRNRTVRTVKVPARKVPNNRALNTLITAAKDFLDIVEDIEVAPIRKAHRRLEDALGPFLRVGNEIGS